jgi:hypothetical protein
LERRELGAREGAEGDYAVDEALWCLYGG